MSRWAKKEAVNKGIEQVATDKSENCACYRHGAWFCSESGLH